jgi:hypothetical protein
MRILFLSAIAAAGLAASYGTAYAQRGGVEVDTGPRYDNSYYNRPDYVRPGARVYGYSRDGSMVVERGASLRPLNCGEFRYWNGTRCADARVDPPRVD